MMLDWNQYRQELAAGVKEIGGLKPAPKRGYLEVGNTGTPAGLLAAYSQGKFVAALSAGAIIDAYLPLVPDTSNVSIKLFKGIVHQYAPSLPWDGNVLYGVSEAYTLVQGLIAAGRNPTRQDLVQTLETKSLTGGPGLVPFGFSKSSHLGYMGTEIVKTGANGLGQTVLSPRYVSTNSGPIKVYSAALSPPPASGIPSN